MRHFRNCIGFWGGGCFLALVFAQQGWAQTDPCRVAVLLPAEQPEQSATPPSPPLPVGIDQRETQLSPYRHWQQQQAPPPSGSFSSAFYRLSQRAEPSPEGLPFGLKPEGIPLGEGSPFFLHVNGLVYRLSY